MSDRPRYLDGVMEWLDFRYEAPGTIRMTIREEMLNRIGLLSGPIPYALVDYAMGGALWMQREEGEAVATISISINYVATAREGDIRAIAQVDRRNRTNAVLRAEVRTVDDGERLLATAVGSFAIFRPR
jgi:uncharacterized protein (TIGR00369 family)